MKRFKKVIAVILCVLMAFELASGYRSPFKVNRAVAAGTNPAFTKEAFGECYAKVLLTAVGNSYQSSGGYYVTGNVANATPFNPATIPAQSFDCCGLVITGLLAMGYTKFVDAAGKEYPLNNQTGFNALRSVNGLAYNHKTGDMVTLVHRDSQYNMKFKIGEIVDVSTLNNVSPGTILLNLANERDAKPQVGKISVGQVGGDGDNRYYISHTSVAIFSLEENPDYSGINGSNCWDTQAHFDRSHAALQDSWNRAYAKVQSLYGQTLADKVGGSHTYTKGSNSYTIPNMWDARARGFVTATTVGRADGFYDPGASFHFTTPYSNIWQVEAIETGVSVNNNPYGKFNVSYSLSIEPVFPAGDIEITKTDADTAELLTGAEFALYEWSESNGQYSVCSNYKIAEVASGKYGNVNASNRPEELPVTDDNKGKFRVIEMKAPTNYTNIDSTTGKPFQWDIVFTTDGEHQKQTIDAKNKKINGDLSITKSLPDVSSKDEVFWFWVNGPSGNATDRWVSVTVKANTSNGVGTLKDIPVGSYVVQEVSANGSKTAPISSTSFPYTPSGSQNVTVTGGNTATATFTNTLDKGSLKVTKSLSDPATETKTFWFYVVGGADGHKTEKWTKIELIAGKTSGEVTVSELPIGAYTVYEVSGDGSKAAPTSSTSFPYTPSGSQNVSVTKGGTATATFTNTLNKGSLKITKKLNVASDVNGTFWFHVSGGVNGYKTDKWVSITVTAGQTSAYVILNGLAIGTYTVAEVLDDGSLELAKDDAIFPYAVYGDGDVQIVVNETSSIEISNEMYSSNLSIHKTDADSGVALNGIEFGIYSDAECTKLIEKVTTGADGNAVSKSISLGKQKSGTVYVKEIKTDDLHLLDTEVVKVTLTYGETAKVKGDNWTNQAVKGQIVVKKTGEFFTSVITTDSKYGTVYAPQFTYGQLEGAQFSVFNKADVKVNADGTFSYDLAKAVTTFTTKTNGGESDYIPLGAYYVIETKAPTGYVLEDVLHEVIIAKESETKEIVLKDVKSQNDYQDTSVIIYKEAEYLITTEDNGIIRTTVQVMPGEGFIFGLYAKTEYTATDGKKIPADGLVAYGSTDENGELVFDAQLPHGVYYVKELETLPDYIIDEDVYEVDLSYDADATEIVVEASEDALINRLRTTPVTITKRTLAGDDPLPGTEITIWDANGRVIFKELTGADGTVPAVVLLKGHNYTFQETYAPEGYAVLYQKIPFTVELDGTITGTTTIRDDVSRISFLKVDDDDKPLAGAEFTLYDENGLPIKSVISDENGIAEFTNLGYGKYAIIETQTPKGYSLSDFRYEIEIDGTYENKEPIKVVNHELPKTGVENPLLIILCFLLVAIVSIMAIFSKKKDSFVHVEEYYRQ